MNPEELNFSLIDKIKRIIGENKNVDVTISLIEYNPDYSEKLNQSISQAENGEVISITMEEFLQYNPKKS